MILKRNSRQLKESPTMRTLKRNRRHLRENLTTFSKKCLVMQSEFLWDDMECYSTQSKSFVKKSSIFCVSPCSRYKTSLDVNCPNTEENQNLFVCQYCSKMYYGVVWPKPPGAEMFVYYGDLYARGAFAIQLTRKLAKSRLKTKISPTCISPVQREKNR